MRSHDLTLTLLRSPPLEAMLFLFREEEGGGGGPSPQTKHLKVSLSEESSRIL